jgi:hypothetical protein
LQRLPKTSVRLETTEIFLDVGEVDIFIEAPEGRALRTSNTLEHSRRTVLETQILTEFMARVISQEATVIVPLGNSKVRCFKMDPVDTSRYWMLTFAGALMILWPSSRKSKENAGCIMPPAVARVGDVTEEANLGTARST